MLIGRSVPSGAMLYDEIAELAGPPAPVSDTSTAPFGAIATENAPGPALGFTVIAASRPSAEHLEHIDFVGGTLGDRRGSFRPA